MKVWVVILRDGGLIDSVASCRTIKEARLTADNWEKEAEERDSGIDDPYVDIFETDLDKPVAMERVGRMARE
jgi:hypothetical protein